MDDGISTPDLLRRLLDETGWPGPRIARIEASLTAQGRVSGLDPRRGLCGIGSACLGILEGEQERIREELLASLAQGRFVTPSDGSHGVGQGAWTLLHFFMRRALYADNLAACPSVARALGQMREQAPVAGLWAAWMSAGTELPVHRDSDNTRIRTHLTLDAGEDTALEVEGEVFPFRPGNAITFQPCLTHSAWNRDPKARGRLVLSLDLWHPQLTRYEIAALQYLERHRVLT